MGLRINTNMDAMIAEHYLSVNADAFSNSVEKLSSGLRINRAADDAAGLSISQKLQGQVNGLNQAVSNAQDGISMIQTAEGGLNETHSILQRMRELAVEGANDTLTTDDRNAIGSELSKLRDEIDRIANDTQFNTKNLLQGSLNTSVAGSTEINQGNILTTSTVVVSKLDVSNAAASTTYTLSSTGAGTVTLTNGTTNVAQTVSVSGMTTQGASTQTLNFSQLGVSLTLSGDAGAATAAAIVTDLTTSGASKIVTGTGGAAVLQIGANTNQTMNVSISDARSTAIGNAGTYTSLSAAVDAFTGGPTQGIAEDLLGNIDQAISDVSSNRSSLGAFQNSLQDTVANLQVSSENLTASESQITDVDLASEMVNFTKTQILQQAGTSILAQANMAPQSILKLLQ